MRSEGGYSVASRWSNDRSTDEAYVMAVVDVGAYLTCGTEGLSSALTLNVLQVHKKCIMLHETYP